MKNLYRIRRILVGIVFIETLLSLILCSFYLILAILPEYRIGFDLVLKLFIICVSILAVTVVVLIYLYTFIAKKIDAKIYKIIFEDMEPVIAFDYIQRDLSIHTFFTHAGIEKSILQSVITHLYMGNFEQAEVIMNHLNINYFDKIQESGKNVLLHHKAGLLTSAFNNDKDSFYLKYVKYHEYIDLNDKLNKEFPSNELNILIELFFKLFNMNSRLEILKFIEDFKFETELQKYSILTYLMYNEYKLPQYLIDEYELKSASLFLNLDKN